MVKIIVEYRLGEESTWVIDPQTIVLTEHHDCIFAFFNSSENAFTISRLSDSIKKYYCIFGKKLEMKDIDELVSIYEKKIEQSLDLDLELDIKYSQELLAYMMAINKLVGIEVLRIIGDKIFFFINVSDLCCIVLSYIPTSNSLVRCSEC
jgi:hypothetical protein